MNCAGPFSKKALCGKGFDIEACFLFKELLRNLCRSAPIHPPCRPLQCTQEHWDGSPFHTAHTNTHKYTHGPARHKSTQKPPAHSLCPEALIITDLALYTVVFVCMGVHIVVCVCMCVCIEGITKADHLLWSSSFPVLCLVTQSCPTLCDPMNYYSPPGSSVHGILQARILEWVAMPSSRGSSQPRDQT